MSYLSLFLGLLLGLILGCGGLLLILHLLGRNLLASARVAADELKASKLQEAANAAREVELLAKQEAIAIRERLDEEENALDAKRSAFEDDRRRAGRDADARELKLDRREDRLDRKAETLDATDRSLDVREKALIRQEKEQADSRRELADAVGEAKRQLTQISGMTEEQAREHHLAQVEADCRGEAAEIVRRSIESAQDEAKEKGRAIVLEAIQRYAAEQCADHTVASIHIADEAMKGRVIGREGRNIRSFEKATGVDVIIDDTPGVVGLSCFDPVRREIARQSLQSLIADGRIHPGRIEEVVNEATTQMQETLVELGKTAGNESHLPDLPRAVVPLLGRLHFRTSYGQNVLRHSQEVAHLAQVMADELGLDGTLARRAGLLHDIGKAMDHETEGGHPEIGAAFLKKHGEPEAVVNAAAGHHGDVPATTPYTPLVMAADAISASRPGARRESLERYVKRLRELEEVAHEFNGVRQAYAIHAGREVRVIADAKSLDDAQSAALARDIAARVQERLSFPGEIRVTVLREVRSVEFAR